MPQISAGGHALEIHRIAGAEPTLVFLHEGLGSIRRWRDFPADVARATGCSALVYDRYGYGDSDVLAETRVGVRYMHDGALRELPALLEELKIGNPVLIGHSDGASIALIYAGSHPVRGIVVMAPHVFVEDVCVHAIQDASERFETGDLPERLAKYHRDARRTFHLWADVWLDPAFRRWNIEEYLARIRCPLLAIQGEDDQYGTMAQLDAIARQVQGPCELLKLPDCRHSPFKDQADTVTRAVTGFVGKIVGTGA